MTTTTNTAAQTTTMKIAQYKVKPFSAKGYAKNEKRLKDGEEPCAICGRAVTVDLAETFFGEVIDGGGSWGNGTADASLPGYMGAFPVGSDCHRKNVIAGTETTIEVPV